jgi:hypothetical protein
MADRSLRAGPSAQTRSIFAAVTFVVGLAWLGQMIWLTGYIIRTYPVPHPYEPLPFIGSLFRVIASSVFAAESLIVVPLYVLSARLVYGRRSG